MTLSTRILTTATLAASVVIVACVSPTAEQKFVTDLTTALGGRDKVDAARVLDIEGEGKNYNLGQDMKPDLASQTFTVTGFHRVVDLTAPRMRTEQTRTPTFAYFQGPQAQTQILGLDGDVGYNANQTGVMTRIAAAATRDRQAELYSHPLVIARELLQPNTRVANVTQNGAGATADVTTADGVTLTIATDATGLPSRIDWKTYHPNLGDVTIGTTFGGYQDVGGLKLPTRIATKIDDFTTADITVTKQSTSAQPLDLSGPPNSLPAPVQTPPNVTIEPVGTGVWFLAGQSHHSVLVEFADHLVLIDAPLSEARALAVIAKAREIVPGKPLTTLVTTHHHFDHTAGMRAAISEGLKVVTQSGNKEWVEAMARRSHSRQPDALAKNPRAVVVEAVDDKLEMNDGTKTMVLYHVAGSPHSDTMLMAYLPAERAIVEVDVFSPGASVHPYEANLLQNITRRQLKVDRIVPLHGAIAKFEELAKIDEKH